YRCTRGEHLILCDRLSFSRARNDVDHLVVREDRRRDQLCGRIAADELRDGFIIELFLNKECRLDTLTIGCVRRQELHILDLTDRNTCKLNISTAVKAVSA